MLECSEVGKILDGNQILDKISLKVRRGSIFGLVGPNGAGKTSLIKIITGIWEQDSGFVTVNGAKVFDNPDTKRIIGYVPDLCCYYDSFKVKEILELYRLAYRAFNEHRFAELNGGFGISLSQRIRTLSKGMKAKLMLALNLSIMPQLLILDEATSGLDPLGKRKFMEILLEEVAERRTTVVICTHNLGDVEQICDTVAVINKGRIKFDGTIDAMKHSLRKLQVVFNNGLPEGVAASPGVLGIQSIGSICHIVARRGAEELEEALKASEAVSVEEIGLSLEDIFVYSLGGENI